MLNPKRPRVVNKRYNSVSLQANHDTTIADASRRIHEAIYHTTDDTSKSFESLTRGLKDFFNASARAAGTSQPSLGRLQVRLTAVSVRAEQVQHLPESPGRRAGTEANEIN